MNYYFYKIKVALLFLKYLKKTYRFFNFRNISFKVYYFLILKTFFIYSLSLQYYTNKQFYFRASKIYNTLPQNNSSYI